MTSIGCQTACLFAVILLVGLLHASGQASPADAPDGVRLNITMREILQSDPPETTIVDTLGVSIAFDHETTLRIGSTILYVTAQRSHNADGPASVHLTYALFVTGPVPEQRADAALVEFGTPLVVDGLRGKGKSAYRILIVPHPASAPAGVFVHGDTTLKDAAPSLYFLLHMNPRSRAAFHFLELCRTLDSEYGTMRDSFGITEPGRIDYHFLEGQCADVPLDPRLDFAVDPSRNCIVSRYNREYSGVDAEAALLLTLYRSWGYAPEFLALGAAGYLSSADLDVKDDRDSGRVIPLDSLIQTFTFKRQPFPASVHHAASFIHWLITTQGIRAFHDVYSKATDLSMERALWSVYGKTLKELETEWLAYLKKRRFSPDQLYRWAMRAAGYHRYTEHYNLLLRAITGVDSVPASIFETTGRAAGQLGHWPVAVQYFLASFKMRPDNLNAISLLAEALWADGKPSDAEFHLKRLLSIDSTAAGAYLLLGDMQKVQQRSDSAAALWRRGLAVPDPGPVAVDLLGRLGNYERHRSPGSSRAHLQRARVEADQLLVTNHGDLPSLIRYAETLMASDSTDLALSYFHFAGYVADSPQDLGRIYVGIGQCHDLAGNRQEAVKAYRSVFQIPAAYFDSETAQYYINHIYKH